MLAQHLHYQPALCFIWPVLDAHVAAINSCLSPTGVIRAAFED
jgi:hypothetical protein